jgi:sigma-E factor negative regulatory protein RseA
MSEQIREQVSAFLDGELPNAETELLLKRLARDAELRESFGRYALIGEACRGAPHEHLTRGLTARINRAIDGEPKPAYGSAYQARSRRWWHPVAGAAVAAGVAAVAVVALQQRAVSPSLRPASAMVAQNIAAGQNKELPIYTTPAAAGEAPAALPAARLTNYVFAHSKYSSVLGQSNVLSGLLTASDEEPTPAPPKARTAP